MRLISWYVGALACALAQVPSADSRNTQIPNTDTHFRMPEYGTLAEWEARRARLRHQILAAAGLDPLPDRTPLRPLIFDRVQHKDYSVEKVALETLPGYYLGGNLYRPAGGAGKFPAVAHPHGHWRYGRLENQPLGSQPARAIMLARQGYIGFSYDMVGHNDTTQTPHIFAEKSGDHEQLWSFGPLGLQLWNSIRVIDFLLSLEDVDAERVAVTGESGGGTQSFLLAAVDDRVKFAAPVNMVSAIMQGGCPCENAPGLRLGAFNVEFAAMIAPRPLLLISATGDWTKNTPVEEFPAVRRIYELYDRAAMLENAHIDAPHNYNLASREAMYRFFGRHILGEADPARFVERGVNVEPLQNLLVWHGRERPAGALTYDGLFAQWKAMAQRHNGAAERETMRARLQAAIGAEWPARVIDESRGDGIVLTRPGVGDRVPGVWIAGEGSAAVVVHPKGGEAARRAPEVARLLASKRPVLLLDAFQTGSAAVSRDRSHRHFLTFNRTDDAHRVQDIFTGAAFAASRAPGAVEVLGLGDAAIWAAFAVALQPEKLKLSALPNDFTGTDEQFAKRFFVPGIQRAGGWAAATALAAAQ
jgi:dienelactone hydrolase